MRTRASIVAVVLALVVGLPTLASGQCPDGSPPPCGRRVALDTARYAILPFVHREGGQQSTLDGADCAELLIEGFARWIEVRLADKTRVYDALTRHGARAPFRIPFDTAVAIARRLGAGKLVMGQLWSFGDTLRLTAGLYDVARGGAPVRESTTRVAANGAIGAAFNALADSLLGADLGAARGAGADQTRSLRALRAYALGERAIREWDLGRAAREFRAAIAADCEARECRWRPAARPAGHVPAGLVGRLPSISRDRGGRLDEFRRMVRARGVQRGRSGGRAGCSRHSTFRVPR